jgi:lipoprotein-anchoring transpeptidase ErfK/SrfK
MRTRLTRAMITLACAGLTACVSSVDDKADTTSTSNTAAGSVQPSVPPASTPAPADAPLRLEVDVAARKLYVFRDGAATDTHAVAVGMEQWPTRTGEWRIGQVIWNPDWTPPDEAWAKDEKPEESGDPDNPLGQVQLVYDAPRSIHGTNQPSSIGKAVSHGSIRMRNDVLTRLAQEVMQAGGAPKDSAWVADARRNRTKKQVVDLPNPVPITVR